MAIKKAKTVAEYKIRKWLEERVELECFDLEFVDDQVARLTDRAGDSVWVVYDKAAKTVMVYE